MILDRKGQLHDTGEPTLGKHIYASDNPVKFSFVDMGEESSTFEVDLAVRRDTRSDPVGIIVRPQQQVADLRMVKRRSRQEIHLVVQRPLVEVEVDRRGVAAVATEAHIPTRDRGIELDRLDVLLVRNRLGEVLMDESVGGRDLLGADGVIFVIHAPDVSRSGVPLPALHGLADREVVVEAA